jgi:hypothetical protein
LPHFGEKGRISAHAQFFETYHFNDITPTFPTNKTHKNNTKEEEGSETVDWFVDRCELSGRGRGDDERRLVRPSWQRFRPPQPQVHDHRLETPKHRNQAHHDVVLVIVWRTMIQRKQRRTPSPTIDRSTLNPASSSSSSSSNPQWL